MTELSTNKTAPKAGTAGFSRLTTDNLEEITEKLCTIDLVLLSRTSTELNNMVEKVAKERVGQLIQNKEITGIRTPIEHMSKKQLIAIICVNEEKP